MAVVRFAMTARTRALSQSARQAVQYLTREGEYAPQSTQEVAYLARESEATASRDDLVWQDVGNLPAWAHGSAATFFTAAETYERAGGRWGTAIQAALPRELSHDQQRALTHDFLQAHLQGKPYLVVMHEPRTPAGDTQPHIHVLFSERSVDGVVRDDRHFFKRANREHPERGGAAKDRFWSEQRFPSRIRQSWCDLTNYHLERAGLDVRVDARSLHERNIARDPERKVGWLGQEGTAYRESMRQAWTQTAGQEHRLAQEHWTERKRVLGIGDVHTLTPEEMQEKSRTWARTPRQAPPSLDDLRTQASTIEAHVRQLDTHLVQVQGELRLAAHQGRLHRPDRLAETRQAAVLAAGAFVGLTAQDDAPQHGAHVRLQDRDRGIGW